jgi:antitoxin component of RelBE/YafQ-DinJ toxin-antitoxin module
MSDYITNDNGVNRPMTPEEKAEYVASVPDLEAQNAAHEAWETDQAVKKLAVLEKLGLTPDEVAALLS